MTAANTQATQLQARPAQLQTGNAELPRLRTTNAGLQTASGHVQTVNRELQTQLTTANTDNGQIAQLQGQLTTANARITQPQAQLTTANKQISQLLAQLTTANGQIAEDADFQEEVTAFMRASNLYLKLLLGLEVPEGFEECEEHPTGLGRDSTQTGNGVDPRKRFSQHR